MRIGVWKAVKWLFTGNRWSWTFYIVSLVAATAFGAYLILYAHVDEKTTVERAAPVSADGAQPGVTSEEELALVKKTTEESIPIVAVIALLTAGGWLVIPLRYLWDERSKDNEHHREDVKLSAEHRRQICSGMLDRIHRYLDLYYARQLILTEMIYGASARAQGAEESGSDEDRRESSGVLLYIVAQYFVHQDWMHRSGALLFLRSTAAEDEVGFANLALGSALMIGLRGDMVRRHLLERGVLPAGVTSLEDAPSADVHATSPRCVDMVEFKRRLKTTNDNNWDDLREVCQILRDHWKEAPVLADIRDKAKMAVERYFLHLNATYREWYEGEASSDETETRILLGTAAT